MATADEFWSATTSADPSANPAAPPNNDAWFVGFFVDGATGLGGNVGTTNKEDANFVWCVRGGSPGPDEY